MLKPEDLQPDREVLAPEIPWYQKKGCLALVIILFLFLALAGVFAWQVYKYYQVAKEGKIPAEILTMFPDQYNTNTSQALVTRDDDPVYGTEGAPITVIAFEDFQCPISGETFPVLKKVLAEYEDKVLFVYRDFPTNHTFSLQAAEAADCAYEQGLFWQYHDLLYGNQDLITDEAAFTTFAKQAGLDVASFDICYKSERYKTEVQKDFIDGKIGGVEGTPTFFINGYKISGSYSEDFWRKTFDYFLTRNSI